jgi:hypothetical protein
MTAQNYLIVESNVVTNNVVWDGNPDTWQPPANSIQLVDATTPAMVWVEVFNDIYQIIDYVLEEQLGAGDIGFIWDGSVLTTNKPKPTIPPEPVQPTTKGTQTL